MPEGQSPLTIVPSRPDHEVAEDLKCRIREALVPVARLADEARAAGMVLQFQLGVDPLGRTVITSLEMIKYL